jgi:hypothetical protein
MELSAMNTRILIAIVLLAAANHTVDAAGLTKEQAAVLDNIEANAGRQAVLDYLDRNRRGKAASRASKAAAVAPEAPPVNSARPLYQDEIGRLVRQNERQSAPEAARASAAPVAAPKEHSTCAGFRFLLRRDWADMDFLGCPKDVADAIGAEVSFANDRAANNRIWSVNGTAALLYNSLADPVSPWLPIATSFGVYTTVNRLYNSSSEFTDGNINKAVYGLTANFLYYSDFMSNMFSFRGGMINDNLTRTSSTNFVAEYSPVIAPLVHTPIPLRNVGLPYWIRVDPSLIVQYNEVTGEDQLLTLNDRNRALRIGPQVAVKLGAYPGGSSFLDRIHASFVYHRAYETYSRSYLTWMTTAVGMNIDDKGHLSLAFTYSRGDDEDTGKFNNIYRLGLAGKI